MESPGMRHVEVIANAVAWNEATPGTGATPTPNAVNDRLIQLWSLPYSVYKAATLAGQQRQGDARRAACVYLSYPLPAPLTGTARVALNTTDAIELTMDSGEKYQLSYWIDRVELRVGNVVTETTYSDYAELNEPDYRSDVFFPRRMTQKRNGMTVLDLTTQRTNTYNPYVVMPVPANVKAAYPAAAAATDCRRPFAAAPRRTRGRCGHRRQRPMRRRRTPRTAIRISTDAGAAEAAARSEHGPVQGLDKDGKRVTYASLEEAKAKATKNLRAQLQCAARQPDLGRARPRDGRSVTATT